MASGWKATTPLVDPMCGSGTLPIEGALIARRMAPGLRRRFAFQSWPDFHVTTWHDVEAEAEAAVLTRSPVRIQGSDRDAGAIEAARANAERAGVTDDIEFSERPISAITPPDEAGWVVSNPPYGVRVGEHDRLRNLYAQLGNVLRARCAGWQIALVSADPALERQLRIPVETILRTSNGGIKVRIVAGAVPMSRVRRPKSETPPDTAAAQRYPS
jgi:putative N6-adenine-specific DNA methylase